MEKVFTRVLIKDESQNILVVQDRADLWNFPGGKLEIGETPAECAKREVQEELGLRVHELTKIYEGEFYFSSILWKGFFYFADSIGGTPTPDEKEKIKGIQFVNEKNDVNFPSELSEIMEKAISGDLVLARRTKWV